MSAYVDYFKADHWEEHWLCEYWSDGAWKLLDAQLGWRARGAYAIKFASDDVPRERFLSASQLWQAIRSGRIKAAQCGKYRSGTSGIWLPASSIMKDVATLCGYEPLPTDYWGPAIAFNRNRLFRRTTMKSWTLSPSPLPMRRGRHSRPAPWRKDIPGRSRAAQ